MNVFIDKDELAEVKKSLAEWAKELPNDYTPNQEVKDSITEECFYTLCKRVRNLEIQNRENAKLKLNDFLISDILFYLMEYEEVEAVLYVDSSHKYEIKTNFSHICGSGKDRIIIIH